MYSSIKKHKMNIICSNCVGSRLYQELGIRYNNPFMWCRMNYDSFRILMTNFNSISFNEFRYAKDNGISSIIIDNRITVPYPHYLQDDLYEIPTLIESGKYDVRDVHYNDIKSFTIEKYKSRLGRMNVLDENVFVLVDNEKQFFTDEDIGDFLTTDIPHRKVLVTNRNVQSNRTPIIYITGTYIHVTEIKRILQSILEYNIPQITCS